MKKLSRRNVVKGLGLGTATVLTGCNLTMKNISFSASADANGNVLLQALITDSVPIKKIEFFDGTTLLSGTPTTPTTPTGAYTFPLSNVTAGTHTYYAVVYDDAGNKISSAPSTVTVGSAGGGGGTGDTTAPTVSLVSSSSSVTAAGNITLSATASDNVGVSYVEIWDSTSASAVLLTTLTAAPYDYSVAFTTANNGSHTYFAHAVDKAGNASNSATITVNVNISSGDTAAPTVSLAASAASITAVGGTTLTATVIDNVGVVKVEFYEDKGTGATPVLLASPTNPPYTAFSHTINFTAADNGTHNYFAKAYDAAGNVGTSAPLVAVVVNIANNGDTTPPTVSLASSGSNVTTAGGVTLTATANDNVGVAKVDFYEGTTMIGSVASAPYTFTVNYSTANNGSHSYTAKAFDAAGNSATSSAVTVTVNISDTTAPTVSLASSSGSVTAAGSITLTATASDNVGVSKVEFYEGATLLGTKTAAPYTQSISFTSANNGSHSYTAKAYDAAGNFASSNTTTVTVNIAAADTTAPTVSLASSSSSVTAAGSVTLTATASDNVGVSKVEFYEGTTLLGTKTAAPYTQSIAFTSANNGSHSYTAKAYDAAGNVATSNAVAVTVNIAAATGTKIADFTQLPAVGSYVAFTANGKSLYLYRSAALQAGGISANGMFFIAYYRACTHQGTNVQPPNATTHLMHCNNHGADFNAETGAFTSPATKMLAFLVITADATSIYY